MAPDERRRYLALGRLMRAQRLQREGRTRNDIARNVAAGLQGHRDELVAKARAKEAEEAARLAKYSAATRITTMRGAHHSTIEQLREQLWIRKVVDNQRIDGKALTIGGNRAELLGRLMSVMLLENEHAADDYDIDVPKSFYLSGGGGSGGGGGKRPAEDVDDAPPPSDCIVLSEERDGERFYLFRARGRADFWVAQSAVVDTRTLELVAAFEEAVQAEEVEAVEEEVQSPEAEGEVQGEAQDEAHDEDDLDAGEFYVEEVLDRRLARRTGAYEYLVRWGGFGADDDSWEPADGLPSDMCEEFDATRRSARGAKRAPH